MSKTNEIANKRFYGFDSLRAIMVLLGLVIHSAVNYVEKPLSNWPFQDSANSPLFDLLLIFIHFFRMPIFFVMTGFFTALLIQKRGVGSMVRNRIQRILIPLVVSWLVICQIAMVGFRYAKNLSQPDALSEAISYVLRGGYIFEQTPTTLHLWFLYYLLMMLPLLLLVEKVRSFLPQAINRVLNVTYQKSVGSFFGPFLFAILTFLTILPMGEMTMITSSSLIPSVKTLAAYFVFFYFGYALHAQQPLLDSFKKVVWLRLLLGFFMFFSLIACYIALKSATPDKVKTITLAGTMISSLATWFFLYAFTGLCLKYWNKPSPRWRYISDASYWVYLIHIIFTIWIPVQLAPVAMSAGMKFLTTLAASTAISFLTYHLFVRSTWIGKALNGRKYGKGANTAQNMNKAA